MSWHYSRALVEEYLAGNCSAGKPSAPSSGMPAHGTIWSPGKTMDASRHSRSGMMYEPLTDALGADVLTWCLAGSRAKTFQQPEKVLGSTGSEAECGWKWPASSAKYDRNSRSWKTRQCSLLEGLDVFSGTWPRWGMMRDGESWELSTPELPTSGNESGSELNWPTPKASDGLMGDCPAERRRNTPGLPTAVHLWPTPTAGEGRRTDSPAARRRNTPGLASAVNMWPTPRACMTGAATPERLHDKNRNLERAVAETMWPTPDAHMGSGGRTSARPPTGKRPSGTKQQITINDAVKWHAETPANGGQLNPRWVEWLMGWPLGWTDCAQSATARYRQWCDSHGICSDENTMKKPTQNVNGEGAE